MTTIQIDPRNILPSSIAKAVAILAAGGVVAFPTETFYGLAADARNERAVERIFEIKGRSFNNPLALIISRADDLRLLTDYVPAAAKTLMTAFWPGPLTILFKASPAVSPRLTAGTGKIGVRISSHPIAQALVARMGRPVTATSANLSGGKECITAVEVRGQMANVNLPVIDGGPTPGGRGSTFLDATVDPPVLLREGAISDATIRALLRK
jgi:L-threonylcarbamoyladenylate synthase